MSDPLVTPFAANPRALAPAPQSGASLVDLPKVDAAAISPQIPFPMSEPAQPPKDAPQPAVADGAMGDPHGTGSQPPAAQADAADAFSQGVGGLEEAFGAGVNVQGNAPQKYEWARMKFQKIDGKWAVWSNGDKGYLRVSEVPDLQEAIRSEYDGLTQLIMAPAMAPAMIPGGGLVAAGARMLGVGAANYGLASMSEDIMQTLGMSPEHLNFLKEAGGAVAPDPKVAAVLGGGLQAGGELIGGISGALSKRNQGQDMETLTNLQTALQKAQGMDQFSQSQGAKIPVGAYDIPGTEALQSETSKVARGVYGSNERGKYRQQQLENAAALDNSIENAVGIAAKNMNLKEADILRLKQLDTGRQVNIADRLIQSAGEKLKSYRQLFNETFKSEASVERVVSQNGHVSFRKPEINGAEILAGVEQHVLDGLELTGTPRDTFIDATGRLRWDRITDRLTELGENDSAIRQFTKTMVDLRERLTRGANSFQQPMETKFGGGEPIAGMKPEDYTFMNRGGSSTQAGMEFPGMMGETPLLRRNPNTGKIERIPGPNATMGRDIDGRMYKLSDTEKAQNASQRQKPTIGEGFKIPDETVVSQSLEYNAQRQQPLANLPYAKEKFNIPDGLTPEQRADYVSSQTAARAMIPRNVAGEGYANMSPQELFSLTDAVQNLADFASNKKQGQAGAVIGKVAHEFRMLENSVLSKTFANAGMPGVAADIINAKNQFARTVDPLRKLSGLIESNYSNIAEALPHMKPDEVSKVTAFMTKDQQAELAGLHMQNIFNDAVQKDPISALQNKINAVDVWRKHFADPAASEITGIILGPEAAQKTEKILKMAALIDRAGSRMGNDAAVTQSMGWLKELPGIAQISGVKAAKFLGKTIAQNSSRGTEFQTVMSTTIDSLLAKVEAEMAAGGQQRTFMQKAGQYGPAIGTEVYRAGRGIWDAMGASESELRHKRPDLAN